MGAFEAGRPFTSDAITYSLSEVTKALKKRAILRGDLLRLLRLLLDFTRLADVIPICRRALRAAAMQHVVGVSNPVPDLAFLP